MQSNRPKNSKIEFLNKGKKLVKNCCRSIFDRKFPVYPKKSCIKFVLLICFNHSEGFSRFFLVLLWDIHSSSLPLTGAAAASFTLFCVVSFLASTGSHLLLCLPTKLATMSADRAVSVSLCLLVARLTAHLRGNVFYLSFLTFWIMFCVYILILNKNHNFSIMIENFCN